MRTNIVLEPFNQLSNHEDYAFTRNHSKSAFTHHLFINQLASCQASKIFENIQKDHRCLGSQTLEEFGSRGEQLHLHPTCATLSCLAWLRGGLVGSAGKPNTLRPSEQVLQQEAFSDFFEAMFFVSSWWHHACANALFSCLPPASRIYT